MRLVFNHVFHHGAGAELRAARGALGDGFLRHPRGGIPRGRCRRCLRPGRAVRASLLGGARLLLPVRPGREGAHLGRRGRRGAREVRREAGRLGRRRLGRRGGDRHARVRVRRERDGELQLVQARVEPHQGTGGEGQQRCARIADPPKPTNPPRRSTPKPEQLSCQPFEPQRRPRRSRASDPATFPTRRSRRAQRCGIPRRAGSSPRSCEISPWRKPWAPAVSPS